MGKVAVADKQRRLVLAFAPYDTHAAAEDTVEIVGLERVPLPVGISLPIDRYGAVHCDAFQHAAHRTISQRRYAACIVTRMSCEAVHFVPAICCKIAVYDVCGARSNTRGLSARSECCAESLATNAVTPRTATRAPRRPD